eukprot:scaffold190276_cov23-Tisochrysis_lutea.AAC.2
MNPVSSVRSTQTYSSAAKQLHLVIFKLPYPGNSYFPNTCLLHTSRHPAPNNKVEAHFGIVLIKVRRTRNRKEELLGQHSTLYIIKGEETRTGTQEGGHIRDPPWCLGWALARCHPASKTWMCLWPAWPGALARC